MQSMPKYKCIIHLPQHLQRCREQDTKTKKQNKSKLLHGGKNMNQQNQTIQAIRQTITILTKTIPTIKNQDVKQSMTNQKENLETELQKLLKRT